MTEEKNCFGQTPGEELANSITHGLGVVLSVAALSVLVTLAAIFGDVWRVVSFSVYGAALVVLYLSSTFYHAFRPGRVKRALHVVDHASIYILIAGTYTPFMLVTMRGPWGWTVFGIIWGLALGGIVLKVFFVGRARFFSIGLYVAMGWLIVLVAKPALAAIPSGGVVWIVFGGLAYTGGLAFYAWERLPYSHTVWHMFVLCGSICHFFAVLFYVLPNR